MPCLEKMLNSEKHMCYKCFKHHEETGKNINIGDVESGKLHIAIPTNEMVKTVAETIAETALDKIFQDIWKEVKNDKRELSQKEFARIIFSHGVFAGVNGFAALMDKDINELKKEFSNYKS